MIFRSSGRYQILARQAQLERLRLEDECRRVLAGNDSPARRWLIDYLKGKDVSAPPADFKQLSPRWWATELSPLRRQLRREFENSLTD